MSPQCGAVYVGGYDVVIECILAEGHDDSHRSHIGQSWNDDPRNA